VLTTGGKVTVRLPFTWTVTGIIFSTVLLTGRLTDRAAVVECGHTTAIANRTKTTYPIRTVLLLCIAPAGVTIAPPILVYLSIANIASVEH